ncbi:MAG: hypothetical protein U9N34_10660, partial [Candidatus Cloacimonadota bacterium]|nr:hypothetical protein [Candidatus Cloacimonadota bacterium]
SYGNSISNAWVTISANSEIVSTDWSDENGRVILPVTTDIDVMDIVVTKHDFVPFINTISVIEGSDLHITQTQIIDSNGIEGINPNEEIEVAFTLTNYGTNVINNVDATITAENENVEIVQAETTFGNISPDGENVQTTNFEINIPPDILDNEELIFHLEISDSDANEYSDIAILEITGINFEVISQQIDNNQDYINPGQNADVVLTINNIGSFDGQEMTGELSCADSRITINDATGYFGEISSNNTQNNDSDFFNVSASSSLITGDSIPFIIEFINPEGITQDVSFLMNIGNPNVTDPIGCDEYGYFCFDDEDEGYIDQPEYDWIEISATGTNLYLNDSGNEGDIETIILPINFSFYGTEYDEITICSNGWIAPGGSESRSFMNWTIPNSAGPTPIIAAFWDDLLISNGDVYYQYFENENYFVIEWNNLRNEGNSSYEETFQMILYDSSFYPTLTGDSNIKVQYQEVNNVDSGTYNSWSIQHGLYATVGIGHQNGIVGLEYTFNNSYPNTAKTLEDNMAILFTTTSI